MAKTLDTKGLNCPLPVLKAKKAMKDMASGERITVLSTDPGSVKDFEAFCQATGDRLVESREENGVFTYVIEKAG
ncbi:MAG: sulfurtransferase TusA family protein [Proteobacteria bacterium]|nr:sulfurtransferase TusA family protein [Pseudomonadota bacterium]